MVRFLGTDRLLTTASVAILAIRGAVHVDALVEADARFCCSAAGAGRGGRGGGGGAVEGGVEGCEVAAADAVAFCGVAAEGGGPDFLEADADAEAGG